MFFYEDHGTCVRAKVADTTCGSPEGNFPILGPNTTEEDWNEAQFLMQQDACTLLELEQERMKPPEERWKNHVGQRSSGQKSPPPNQYECLTSVATRMKDQVATSVDTARNMSGEGMLSSEAEKDTYYRKWQEHFKTLFCNKRVDASLMHDIDQCLDELVATVSDLTIEDGEREGGENCLELFCHTSSYVTLVTRKRGAM